MKAGAVILLMALCAGAVRAETIFETDGVLMESWMSQWHQASDSFLVVPIWSHRGTTIKGAPFRSQYAGEDLGGAMFNSNSFTMAVGDAAVFTMDWQGQGVDAGEHYWWYNFGMRTGGEEAWIFGDIVARSFIQAGGEGNGAKHGFIAWNTMDDTWLEPYPNCIMNADARYRSDLYKITWKVERTAAGFGPSTMTVVNKKTGKKQTATAATNQLTKVLAPDQKLYFYQEIYSEYPDSGRPLTSTVGSSVKVSNMKLEIIRAK